MTSMRVQDPFLPDAYRVQRIRYENSDTLSFELRPADRERRLPVSSPGQFNMLYAFGIGEIPVSISSLVDDESGFIHTVRSVGAVSTALHQLREGDVIGLRGPFGRPWPIESFASHDLLVIAGGLGLAPLRPVLQWTMEHPNWFSRTLLIYGARSPRSMIFSGELAAWQNSGAIKVETTVDSATADWDGHVGSVASLIASADLHPTRTVAFICGPEVMMRFSVVELLQRSHAKDRIFLSMERNMKCAIGICGHCQYGKNFICKDGPVLCFSAVENLFFRSEI